MTLDQTDAMTRERAETLTRLKGTARMGGFVFDVHTEWAVANERGQIRLHAEDHTGWYSTRHEAENHVRADFPDRVVSRRTFTAVSAPIVEES